MNTVYIVCWGSAGQDDDGNSKAYTNVHGVYNFLDDAKKGLVECKDECYNEIVNNPDYDEEDRILASINTSVYGSVNDDHFEIDYFLGDVPCEIYINLVQQTVK